MLALGLTVTSHPLGCGPSPDPAKAGCFVHTAAFLKKKNYLGLNGVRCCHLLLARVIAYAIVNGPCGHDY